MGKPENKPSTEAVAKQQTEYTVTDDTGRTITIRKPGVLAQYRLVEILGDSAANDVYMNMVMPLIYVSAIAGQPVPSPVKKAEVEALIQRLDEHGIAALMKAVNEHFGKRDPKADKAAIKN